MTCEKCRFYVLGKPNAIQHREGVCKRYPVHVQMMKTNWCGEFKAPVKPRKKAAVKNTN